MSITRIIEAVTVIICFVLIIVAVHNYRSNRDLREQQAIIREKAAKIEEKAAEFEQKAQQLQDQLDEQVTVRTQETARLEQQVTDLRKEKTIIERKLDAQSKTIMTSPPPVTNSIDMEKEILKEDIARLQSQIANITQEFKYLEQAQVENQRKQNALASRLQELQEDRDRWIARFYSLPDIKTQYESLRRQNRMHKREQWKSEDPATAWQSKGQAMRNNSVPVPFLSQDHTQPSELSEDFRLEPGSN